ncbi:MAG TPA: NAD(P)-dependent alcohol dehydrogenase [Casimicrobiaceae bacterium]
MRALRFARYGPPEVLRIEELPEPVPSAGQAKVRVRAVSLNPLDWKLRAGHLRFIPLFRAPPRGLGCDFAGEIVGVGGGATERYMGERVFGSLLPFGREGALAQYIVVKFDRLLPIPSGLDEEHAAALPVAAGAALQALSDHAHLVAGQRVLILGAAGGVGHFAVQIAKHLGAYVVGACSAGNADFVRGLGADEVIDYAREDFTRRDDRFDVVFDVAGAATFWSARRVIGERGCYISTGGDAKAVATTVLGAMLARLSSSQRAIAFSVRDDPRLWRRIVRLVQQGALLAHVEHTIGMEDVAQAQRAMQTGHGRGKIVVRLD